MKNHTVMVSGGFDPLHVGHLRLIQNAAQFGDVIVVVNSDAWLMRKKGYVFMPKGERMEILRAIEGVDDVYCMDEIPGSDDDGTVCRAIQHSRPTFFANGGDRRKDNVPELEVCDRLGVHMLWGIGGDDKPQSSSWLVNKAMEQLRDQRNSGS